MQDVRRIRAAALSALAFIGGGLLAESRAGAQLVAPGAGQQWSTTWSDEFNTGASDLTGWTYDVGAGGWGNQEQETYTAPPGAPNPTPNGLGFETTPTTGTNSSNVFVANDVATNTSALHIDAIATGTTTRTYTSGRIKTPNLFSQAYGLFEFRAKLPVGQGLWPAVWMLPANAPGGSSPAYGGWPTSGEIDVLESTGQNQKLVQGSLHSGSSVNTHVTQTRTFQQSGQQPAGFSTSDWHTYSLEWTPGSTNVAGTIKWYVDGVLYESQQGGWYVPTAAPIGDKDAPFDKPFYFLINLAVGGSYAGNPNIANGTYDMQVDYLRAYSRVAGSALPTWEDDASGKWSDRTAWVGAVIPNALGATAQFGNAITQSRTVNVDIPVTASGLVFDNAAGGYVVTGSQSLTLNTASVGTPATIDVYSGSHRVTAPLVLARNTTITTMTGSSLALDDVRPAAGAFITKENAGTLALKNLRSTGGLVVNGGSVVIPANGTDAAASKFQSLSLAGTAAQPTASLDLNDNKLVVDYSGSSPIDQYRQWIKAGSETGAGLLSSLATSSTRLGYAEASTLGLSSFGGQSTDATSLVVELAYSGDTNLDGSVDIVDLGKLASHWQGSALWSDGDFNYDGVVNITDLGMLAGNWQSNASSLAQALAGLGLPNVSVPEPSTAALAIAGSLITLARRRRTVPQSSTT